MKGCPKCKSTSRHRMRRKIIAKLIPGAKQYACDNCNIEYAWIPLLNVTLKV